MEFSVRAAELTTLLESRITNFYTNFQVDEIGRVVSVGDGIARVYGLNEIQAGEMVEFASGVKGIALNLENENVGIMVTVLLVVFVSRILVGPVISKMERPQQKSPQTTLPSASPSSSSNNNKKRKKEEEKRERRTPNYQILFEEYLLTVIHHLQVMHKRAYPSCAQPSHYRWKQTILRKVGEELTMEERFNALCDLVSGLKQRYDTLLDADSSSTFQELLGILNSIKGGKAR
jgi:hypothetical protein